MNLAIYVNYGIEDFRLRKINIIVGCLIANADFTDIFNKKGSFRIAVNDIFNSWKFNLERNFGGLFYSNQGSWESRQLRVSFTYYFGNKNIKSAGNLSRLRFTAWLSAFVGTP